MLCYPVFFWAIGFLDPTCCSFLTWFGHDFPAGQFASVRSFLIAAMTQYSGFFLSVPCHVPWSQRLSFNITFCHLEICDAKRWSKRWAGRKGKPLVATVENLTFMLAQHLTAVKDVIFFWPITKGDRIYNLLSRLGGSVLRYSEINYFVGRRGEPLPRLQAVKLSGSCFHS